MDSRSPDLTPATLAAAAAGAPPFLELRDVHKRFAGVHALRGVNLTIEAGRIYHLMGENGSGKSTLIKIISGAQAADEGAILINGQEATSLTPLAALSAGIETVYQDLSLLPNLSVADNIALSQQLVESQGRLARRIDSGRLVATAVRALEAVNLPTDPRFWSIPVEQLPIATRQLVAIARAMATSWRVAIGNCSTGSDQKRGSVGRLTASSARTAVVISRPLSMRRASRPCDSTNCCDSAMFSATERFGNSDRSW